MNTPMNTKHEQSTTTQSQVSVSRRSRKSAITRADWLIPTGLILLTSIPALGGVFGLVGLATGTALTADDTQFRALPLPIVLHIVSALPFCLLGAFQFAPGLRRRWPRFHRLSGRLVALCGLTAGLSGLWMTQFVLFSLPSQSMLLYSFRMLFGSAMVLSLVLGLVAILRRNVARHRAWMIRGYAIGQGAGTQALTALLWMLIFGTEREPYKDLLMGASWVINLAVAEWLIRRKRTKRHSLLSGVQRGTSPCTPQNPLLTKEGDSHMKAIICTKYGPPEVLQLQEVEKPVPRDNEVLVKVSATTVTAGESLVRRFAVPPSYWLLARLAIGWSKPRKAILGMVVTGEVEAVGNAVTRFQRGDQVFAYDITRFRTYAEYTCLPENSAIARKPSNVTSEEAAAIPYGGITALHFLKRGKIEAGQHVLIYGASGSVGTFAVQLAKHFGAHVTGVCSTTNVALVKSLGADQVIDYTREDWTRNGETYDVLFDAVGKTSFPDCLKVLKKEGVYLQLFAAPALSLRMRLAGMTSSRTLIGGEATPKTEDLISLKELVEAGKIKPVIDRRYPLEQIVEAHRYVDQGHKKGDVVITVQQHNQTK